MKNETASNNQTVCPNCQENIQLTKFAAHENEVKTTKSNVKPKNVSSVNIHIDSNEFSSINFHESDDVERTDGNVKIQNVTHADIHIGTTGNSCDSQFPDNNLKYDGLLYNVKMTIDEEDNDP